ncbi:MAG TPA: hypothetical protein PLV62_01870 [Spirochaetota bacterium]|nr:hypothetical protein [Spirochaetota bacterium]HPK43704.1 hypothetical protein [Spirochaetota bacterium]
MRKQNRFNEQKAGGMTVYMQEQQQHQRWRQKSRGMVIVIVKQQHESGQ